MNALYRIPKYFLAILVVFSVSSCRKFVEIDPPRTDLVKETVFNSDATANAAMLDIYYQMGFHGFSSGNVTSFSFLGSLSSDEQIGYFISDPQATTEVRQFNDNTLMANSGYVLNLWSDNYKNIYKANVVIEGLASSSGVSESLKRQLEGEAKFIRAFFHFYLVNLWGDVPLVTATDYRINNSIRRTPKAEVYQQIIADLKDAQMQLSEGYSFSNNERIRVNKGAATALLARVYLYTEDWINAENQATSLISNTPQYNLLPVLGNVFKINNSEAIWQLWSASRPKERATFRFLEEPIFGALSPEFVTGFELGDLRRNVWILTTSLGYYSCIKYSSSALNPPDEYSTILRLAEQYLIRAEARANQGNITGANSAESDINVIRNRAGLTPISATTQSAILSAIERERKHELFNEWGHRWLDLKRTGRADAVLSAIKPQWRSYQQLFPIPEAQIINNPATTQNTGY